VPCPSRFAREGTLQALSQWVRPQVKACRGVVCVRGACLVYSCRVACQPRRTTRLATLKRRWPHSSATYRSSHSLRYGHGPTNAYDASAALTMVHGLVCAACQERAEGGARVPRGGPRQHHPWPWFWPDDRHPPQAWCASLPLPLPLPGLGPGPCCILSRSRLTARCLLAGLSRGAIAYEDDGGLSFDSFSSTVGMCRQIT
jgi:hypothetical protein